MIAGCSLSLHDALPICEAVEVRRGVLRQRVDYREYTIGHLGDDRYAWRNRVDRKYAGKTAKLASEMHAVSCCVPDSSAVEIERRDGEVGSILPSRNRIA